MNGFRFCVLFAVAALFGWFASTAAAAASDDVRSKDKENRTPGVHTALTFSGDLSLNEVTAALEQLDRPVVALEHTGPTRGGIRAKEGLPAGEIASAYRYALGKRADKVRVFGARIDGRIGQTAASRLDNISIKQRVEITSTTDVVFDATSSKIITTPPELESMRSDTQSATTSSQSLLAVETQTTDNPEAWVPSTGMIQAFNNPNAPGGLTREMYHELVWNDPSNVAAFENDGWAYEHDFKLLNEAATVTGVPPACAGPGADDFWADRDALVNDFWETNMPTAAVPYFDTRATDSCKEMDWTVGVFKPLNLTAGVQYFIRVLGGAGDTASSQAALVAERLPNDCGGYPNKVDCINIDRLDNIEPEGEILVQGEPLFTVPGCREWRADAAVSFGCATEDDIDSVLVPDGPPVAVLATANQTKRLRFTGQAGQRLHLGWSESTIQYSQIRVFSPSGAQIASTVLGRTSTGEYNDLDLAPLPADGEYTIVVDPQYYGSVFVRLMTRL